MTNRKLKGKSAVINLIAREYYDCIERNVCCTYLALLHMGISRSKVYALDDDFHEQTVPEFRKEANDGAIEVIIDRFLTSVQLQPEDVRRVSERFRDRIARAFPTADSYTPAMQSAYTDFAMMLYELHAFLGYGHKRLLKVIDFITKYKGDEKKEVEEKLHIFYPPPDTLPDTAELFKKPRRAQIDRAELERIRCEMQAVRMIQRQIGELQ